MSALTHSTGQLKERPLAAVTQVVDLLASDVLPWLAAREPRTSSLYLELSQAAEALTIVALRPSLRRAATSDLRLVRAQLEKLHQLVGRLAEIEAEHGSVPDELEEKEDAARQGLHFIAPPSRPATEAHVLRQTPRPVEVWSPERTHPPAVAGPRPDQLAALPLHPIPEEVTARGEQAIELTGLVERPRRLLAGDLRSLPHAELTAEFGCEEGWKVAGVRWRGVRLADVLALASVLNEARYVRVSSGSYAVVLPLESAREAMLCDELEGAALGPEHGGPWRLVVPDRQCFTSAKWVDRLEVTAEPGAATAEAIARKRLARAAASTADT